MKRFDHPSDQAAFERWVDVTAELLQKYGPAFLRQMEEMRKTKYAEYDRSAKVLRFERPTDYSLERNNKVA